MKNHVIDNSLKNLGKTVLWQYDRAVRLLSVLKHMQVLYHCAVEQFWDYWTNKVLALDTCGTLGCSIWGILLGVPRPTITDITTGEERLIATAVYRRILKGAFYLMKASSSFEDILGYLEIVFGVGNDENLSKWSVYVSEFGWTTNIDELNGAYVAKKAYAPGDVVWHRIEDAAGNVEYDGNWKFIDGNYTIVASWDYTKGDPPEWVIVNNSWEDVVPYVEKTEEELPKQETLLLKLFDPEGICRKIGGAPANSLSIRVEYDFGETRIVAEATRRRKCGITLTDNGDMSMTYGKSEYYDEMHRDQKALFEQKMDEFCPFPLGIRTNEPIGNWVFGVRDSAAVGQSNVLYKSGVAYPKGSIFGYIEEDGNGFNWKASEDISASENTSFDSIKGKLQKTGEGGPFIDGLGESHRPFLYYRDTNTHIPIHVATADKKVVATIIAPDRMVVGLEDGLDKIFRNTTGGYLVVCHVPVDETEVPHAKNFTGFVGVEEPTEENIRRAIAEMCRTSNCPVVGYDTAIRFMEGVFYYAGDVVIVDEKERIVTSGGKWDSKDGILANSVPQSKACLHKQYPFIDE